MAGSQILPRSLLRQPAKVPLFPDLCCASPPRLRSQSPPTLMSGLSQHKRHTAELVPTRELGTTASQLSYCKREDQLSPANILSSTSVAFAVARRTLAGVAEEEGRHRGPRQLSQFTAYRPRQQRATHEDHRLQFLLDLGLTSRAANWMSSYLQERDTFCSSGDLIQWRASWLGLYTNVHGLPSLTFLTASRAAQAGAKAANSALSPSTVFTPSLSI